MIDASAAVELLVGGTTSRWVARALEGYRMHCPDLAVTEVLNAIRRLERTGKLDSRRAEQAVEDFAVMPCTRWTTYPLLREVWALRANMTSYDAAYVALARRLACPLVTTDVRLSRVPDLRITVLVP